MANPEILGVILGVALFLILIIFLYIVKNYKKLKEPESQTFLLNFMSDFTEGYGIGKSLDEKSNKHKKKHILFPFDIDYKRIKEKGFDIKEQPVIVKRQLDVDIDISRRAKIKALFPHNPELLSSKFRNSLFGTYVEQFILDVSKISNEQEINNLRNKRVMELKERSKDFGLGSVADVIRETPELISSMSRRNLEYPTTHIEKKKDEQKS